MFGYQACHVCAQIEHVLLSRVHAEMKTTVSQNLPKHVFSLHWRSTWTLPHMLSFPGARITWKQTKV